MRPRTWQDYADLLKNLMPPGAAWMPGRESVLSDLLEAIGIEFSRVDKRSGDVLDESDPRTTKEMIGDWESALGLPDPCAGRPVTLQERRGEVVSKLTSVGSQTPKYFKDLAEELGFSVTIDDKNRAFRAGVSRADDRLYGEPWEYAWKVNAPSNTFVIFRAGRSAADEPIRVWGQEQSLECAILKRKPAHTVVIFNYE